MEALEACYSAEGIRATLSGLPTNMNMFYARNLKKINTPEASRLAVHTFMWLSTSRRALTLGEVVESLAVKPDTANLPKQRPLLVATDLVKICGSLVNHDKRTNILSLSHYSVKVGFIIFEDFRHQEPRVPAYHSFCAGISDLRMARTTR